MPKQKTITIVDVQQGRLTLQKAADTLHVRRVYTLVDATDKAVEGMAGGNLSHSMPWNDVPKDVQSAFATIDAWTYGLILKKEKMEVEGTE